MRLTTVCLSLCLLWMSACTEQMRREKHHSNNERQVEPIKSSPSPGVKDMCIKSACASLPLASSQAKGMMKFSLSELPSCKVKPKLNPLEDMLSDPSLNDSLRWTRLQALSQSWAHEARLIKTQQDLYHSQLCALEVIRVHLEQVALSDYKLFLGSQKMKPSP